MLPDNYQVISKGYVVYVKPKSTNQEGYKVSQA